MKHIAARGALVALICTLLTSPAFAESQEQQIGAQVYSELSSKGEIIARPNAMYDILDPIATRIKTIADPQYDYPFHFILVHEKQPNAFAVPGGNVYVTDSLIHFVQNKEELAGVLCHETSHDIHHDVVHNMQKDQMTGLIIGGLGTLLGIDRSQFGQLGENLAYSLQTSTFSREVEHNADAKGAITCAQAGYNPWGMVWLFQNFEKSGSGAGMEILSDHPSDSHRIEALQSEFAGNPALFGRFSHNIATGTPIASASSGYSTPARRTVPHRAAYHPKYCCAPSN